MFRIKLAIILNALPQSISVWSQPPYGIEPSISKMNNFKTVAITPYDASVTCEKTGSEEMWEGDEVGGIDNWDLENKHESRRQSTFWVSCLSLSFSSPTSLHSLCLLSRIFFFFSLSQIMWWHLTAHLSLSLVLMLLGFCLLFLEITQNRCCWLELRGFTFQLHNT